MECKQCKLYITPRSRSKVFIGYCKHCSHGIPLPKILDDLD